MGQVSDVYKGDIRSCDVCHREREIMVHCSSFAAYSFGSCAECLGYYAEPAWVFEYLRDWVDNPEANGLREEVYVGAYTYWDDQYLPYNEWLKLNPFDAKKHESDLDELQRLGQKWDNDADDLV
jgi:hypothetical protein